MTPFPPIIGSISLRYNYYSAGLTVSIIDLNCTGSEDTILSCPNNALLGQHTCYYAAGIACQSKAVIHVLQLIAYTIAPFVNYTNCTTWETRLSGSLQGRVELCYNNVWYGICGDNSEWYYYTPSAVCEGLGYDPGMQLCNYCGDTIFS